MRILPGILCCLFAMQGICIPQTRTRETRIRSSAERAIVDLQASQKHWFERKACTSCHHQFLPPLAFRTAREHGIPVNEDIARSDAARAFRFASLAAALEHANVFDPGIGDSLHLVAADAAGVRPNLVTAADARFLALRQKADGHWISFDERPPQSYSVFTATALSLRALDLFSHPGLRADTRARIARARTWLASHMAPDTEGRAFQLLGLLWSGADRTTLDKFARQLMNLQQADGGWNSLDGRASDAYSTGQALVALHDAGHIGSSDPAWQRGITFLLDTQKPDGSWHVETRLHPPAPLSPDYFESGYPYGHDQFISIMGASWAIMALADALPSIRKAPAPPPLKNGKTPEIEPWAETVLFGSASELRGLLDHGFDPNSAMKSGGLTALMLAAPDVEKLKLLLDHGANVNTRSKDGYSALMMACLYTGSAPAVRLLLDRGARAQPRDDEDLPLNNAYPLALAALAGNPEAVTMLHRAGDEVDEIYTYAGLSPGPPLLLIASTGDTSVAQALLDAGAPVDPADPEGLTPLFWAVLANQPEIVKLLIEHGADVNHTDKHGMTPLLYAASVDYGDSRVINLLLKSGARDRQKALDLARRYNHTRFIKSLSHSDF